MQDDKRQIKRMEGASVIVAGANKAGLIMWDHVHGKKEITGLFFR